jgi:hypothetical protein
MRRRFAFLFFCLLGILTNAVIHGPALRLSVDGVTDFISLYSGARLVGTPDLYNPPRMLEVQAQAAGWSTAHRLYCRPPYYAMLLWPLCRLPYLQAYYVWQALSVLAVALFAWLWPIGGRSTVVAVCCWSFPICTALAQGQDDSFVLAAIGIAVCLMRAGRPFAAGLVFTVCATKFQLFLLVPFWIVSQRLWQFGRGFVTGAACLVAVSFLAGGLRWPLEFLALLADPATNPTASLMPNVHGVFAEMPYGLTLEIASAVGISAVALWSFRRMSFEYGLAMTTAAGILMSHHAFVSDCALLIPGLLILFWRAKTPAERFFAVAMFTPFAYIGSFAGPLLLVITRLALASFVGVLAWIAWRDARPPAVPAPSSPGV